MASVIAARTSAHWLEVLDREDVPCAPVLSRDELHLHPQVIANEIIVEDEHPVVGLVRQARPAERMEGTPSEIRLPAPTLGQHTDDVLSEFGFDASAIQQLKDDGVV